MGEGYVKTADLTPDLHHQGWVWCPDCYGNLMTDEHETTDEHGAVCPRCDGAGTLWRVGRADSERNGS